MGIADKVVEQLKGLPQERQRLVLQLVEALATDPIDDDDEYSTEGLLEYVNGLAQKRQRLVLELAEALATDPLDDDDVDDEYSPDAPFDCELSEYLQYCLEVRERQVADHFKTKGVDPVMLIGRAKKCAESLFEATRHLGSTQHLLQHRKDTFLEEVHSETEDFVEAMKALDPEHPEVKESPVLDIWDESLDVVLAKRVIAMLDIAKERFDDLNEKICGLKLTQLGCDFLAHVATCYMFGFDAECIVMCRSVLDVEFWANVRNDDCLALRRPGAPRQRIGLKERIGVALRMGLVDEETHDLALKVVREGDENVHMTPRSYESGLMEEDTRDLAEQIADAEREMASDLEREVDDAMQGTPEPIRNSLDLIVATLKVLKALRQDGSST